MQDDEDTVVSTSSVLVDVEEREREGTKSPIQEIEEEPFVKVEIKEGLGQLNEALKGEDLKEIRSCYSNLTKTFPTANLIWYSWAQFEYVKGNFDELEKLFTKCLKNNLSVPLWKLYLSYVRNNQLKNIPEESEARQMMLKAYDFAVGHVGLDVASGPIWSEYLEFTQSNYYKLVNEKISTWEQQQLMDLTRKIYHRALINPMEGLETLWHSYDSYENSLNKLTAKKIVSERSPAYMSARSSTKELMEIISGIDLEDYPTSTGGSDRFISWMKWINWEKRNPLTLANKPLLHSRIVYAYRRALMSMRGDDQMWLSYANYLRFHVNKVEDCELVLKQARKCCPESLRVVLAAVDLRESRISANSDNITDLDSIRPILDEFISHFECKLNGLKGEIIEKSRIPNDPEDDEIIFENALIERNSKAPIQEYFKAQDALNGAYVRSLELSRRLGGLSAGRSAFASARKSVHASSAIFSAAASLEFRIRKDPSIAAKIYELGLNRFPTDLVFAREYLKFVLAQNDDSNIRALFERIVASVEGFRSTHSREIIQINEDTRVIKEIWADFHAFERDIGDYQSVLKLEERMRAAFPEESEFKTEALFMSKLPVEDEEEEAERQQEEHGFTLPQVRQKLIETGPFHLSESLFNLLLKLSETGPYDGPQIDPGRFISFIERVNFPSTSEKDPLSSATIRPVNRSATATNANNSRSKAAPAQRRRRDRDNEDDRDERRDNQQQRAKQSRNNSSIFEDRRRY